MPLTSDSLVSTKLRPPEARPKLVARSRLTDTLERESGRRLTLVSAPAGFGKTTLLKEWLESHAKSERSVAWISLDEGDNDPARFLSYLVAALKIVEQGIREGLLSSLRAPEPPRIEALAGALVNEMAALPDELAIVLDDYHVIEAEPVHGVVSFLLDHLPEGAHLLIASRIDPPLLLSRLRARGQMVELRATDLRFTLEESAAFLKDVMGLDLSPEDIAALEERTEGWIASLQLAALSMRDREDLSGFIESFSGSHRDVLDFLAEEVLERQPKPVRGFLLRTSILDRLSGALCDAVTGASDGQAMLERLDSENLFLIPLDAERRWYRYHHLFADFLRGRLEREDPERIKDLHRQAAAWYERNGWASEAIRHALAAEDHERAARLVDRVARETWSRGEVLTLLGWLRVLPEEAMRRRPKLFLDHAAALVLTGRPDDIEPLLREAERAANGATAGETRRWHLLGYAAAVRSWDTRVRGDAPRAIELARLALSLLPEDDPGLRCFAANGLGEALWTTGDLAAASKAFVQAAEFGQTSGHVLGTLAAMYNHALVQMERGRLRDTYDILQQAMNFAAERGCASVPAAGRIHLAMGMVYYQWNDLDRAERELMEWMELAERTGKVRALILGYITLSQVRWAREDVEGALITARKAERVARSSGVDLESAIAAAWMIRLRMSQGDLSEATAFEQEIAVNPDATSGLARMVGQITQARLLHVRGKNDEALRLLEELHEEAETAGRMGSAIEILALKALSLQAKGKKERTVSTLARALALAEPENYVRTFVDEGPPMAELLSEVLEVQQRRRLAASDRVPAHYLRKLLAAIEREATPLAAGPPRSSNQLPEPLSERELEVLALIAAGKSNPQIAKELFVAVGTVKTHVKSIYRKLDARSRTQAVSKARELNLI